ncbi:MAG: hypothetical protein HQL31_10860, partial [Planctomycetes bacterium]|nr:hypothetical protein [Planctomycetota bacterium]
ELARKESELTKTETERRREGDQKAQAEMDKAQESILESYNAMDPEEISKILTGGTPLEFIPSSEKRLAAVKYASEYIAKMSSRKRAGVLQELGPVWAKAVNNYLEGAYTGN